MKISSMELYDALISVGVGETKAKEAATAVVSRAEATQILATKSDLKDLRVEIYKALAAQTIILIGSIVGIVSLIA